MKLYSRLYSIGSHRYAVPILLLVLEFVFLSPGMPPFRVAAPMDQLLIFPPWHAVFPEVEARLRGSDILFQQLPWHHWMQDELLAGRFPLWVSGPLGGYPLFAYYQTGALYPLHLLWALLPTGAGFGPIMALKLWIAGLGMWLFLRALNLHWTASLLASLGFMFSAGLVVWLPWSHTNAHILLPWLCLAAYEWCINRKKGALAAFAFLWACDLLGGSPEWFFIVAICTGIWALGLILSSSPRKWAWQAGGLAGSVIVGTLIGAIQLLPFFESLGLSHISTIRPVDAESAIARARLHLDASMMMNWIEPRWWGQVYDGVLSGILPNESNGYIGQVALIGLVLLGIGLIQRKISLRFALPWVTVVVLCWIVVYDDSIGILVRRLPGFSQMVNYRFLIGLSFGLLVLGALGWDRLARWLEERTAQPASGNRAWVIAGLTMLGLSAIFLLVHWLGLVPKPNVGMTPDIPLLGALFPPNSDYRWYWTSWQLAILVGIIGAGIVWWATAKQIDLHAPSFLSAAAPVAIGVFLIADLWQLLYTFNPTAPADWYYPDTTFTQQVTSLVPPTERFIAEGESLLTHTGLIYGYRDWRAQEPMFTERALQASLMLDPDYRTDAWNRYNMSMHDIRLQVAPMLGIRYFVFPNNIDPNNPAVADSTRPPLKKLADSDGLGLWEAEGVPGFAYLSDNITTEPDEASARNWMSTTTWTQTRAYASMIEAPLDAISTIQPSSDGSSPGAVSVDEYTPGHIRLTANAQRPSLLVVSESYYPGWHATLDGQPVQILRANYLSQGIVVPAGQHTIEMKYEPDSFRNGALLSVAGLLGLAGLFIWARRKPTQKATASA